MSKLTLRELGLNYKNSDSERDFNALYHAISPGLKIYIKRYVKDADEADDVFSYVISVLYKDVQAKFDPSRGNISTWIYRVAYNAAMYLWRAKRKENKISLTTFSTDSDGLEDRLFSQFSVENTYMVEEEKKDLDENTKLEHKEVMVALERLPKLEKDLLIERWVNETKYENIAKKFKLPLHSVKNKISRGKKKFYKIYEENKINDENLA
jgi:RNA polymerase sigma factor (sigma-70 family)